MIDFEKEKFLQRLDIRLYAISGMLEYHEKHIANILCKDREYREAQRNIEKMRRDFLEYIAKTDREIRDKFERLIKEVKTDEEATEDVVAVVHAEWVGTEYDGYADGYPVYDKWECSHCHEEFSSEGEPPQYNYCPECGAKMDGERKEKMKVKVNLGDVFYKVETTDHKAYHRECRVCKGKRELTINEVTFKCPVCYQEGEVLRVHGFFVRRYRVFSEEHFIDNSDWKYDGKEPKIRYELYHKSGRGYFYSDCVHKVIKEPESTFSSDCKYFNCPDPNEHSVTNCLYSDYKLAVAVAEKLTKEQIDKVRAYNEANNTTYELPVFNIEHDKKSN